MTNGRRVVIINRALAVAEVHGAATALATLNTLADDPRLADYQPYWAARAELLSRSGAHADANHAYDVAIGLEQDEAVRRVLQGKKA